MKKTNWKKIISCLFIFLMALPLLGLVLSNITLLNLTSLHSDPVQIDENYDRVFKGVPVKKENTYSSSFTYTTNLAYRINTTDLTACVSQGTNTSATTISIPAYYSEDNGTTNYKIIAIDYSGFANNISLTKVTFENANNIEIIDSQAFAVCTSLKYFNSTTSGRCAIPSNAKLTKIYSAAFMDDYTLTSLTFAGNNIAEIQDNAFCNCWGINSDINFKVGTGGLIIGNSAFAFCTRITKVLIPKGCTSIGERAFIDCRNMSLLAIPSSVTSIGVEAFRDCIKATAYIGYSVRYPSGWPSDGADDGTDTIGTGKVTIDDWNYAKYNIAIPIVTDSDNFTIDTNYQYTSSWVELNSTTHAGFWKIKIIKYIGTTNTTLTVPETMTVPGDSTYAGLGLEVEGGQLGVVTEIGPSAFAGNGKITTLTLPNTLETIDASAFYNMTKMTSLTFGDAGLDSDFTLEGDSTNTLYQLSNYNLAGLTTIDSNAFQKNYVVNLTIPSTVVTIGSGAFRYSYTQQTVTFQGADGSSPISKLQEIGTQAFSECGESLTESNRGKCNLILPKSLTSLGYKAFYINYSLRSIEMKDSENTTQELALNRFLFSECPYLRYVIFPNTVKAITYYDTFDNDSLLDWIYLPSSITSITKQLANNGNWGTRTFLPIIYCGKSNNTGYKSDFAAVIFSGISSSGCSVSGHDITDTVSACPVYYNISRVSLTASDTSLDLTQTANQNVIITNDSKGIQYYNDGTNTVITNYLDYSTVTAIDISSLSINKINDYAFTGSAITSMVLPSSNFTSIGTDAFINSSALASIGISSATTTLPSSLTSVGKYAFVNTALTSVTVPASTSSIGDYAFWNISALTDLNISAGNASYQDSGQTIGALYQIAGSNYKLLYVTGSQTGSYTVLSGTTEINSWAFSTCKLTTVILPNSVATIDDFAFHHYNQLTITTVNLASRTSSSLSYIGIGAFCDYSSITSITLPNNSSVSILALMTYAFRNTGISSITFPNNGTTHIDNETTNSDSYFTLGSSVFAGCTNLTSISIPSFVTNIDDSCFNGNTNLTNVYLNGVDRIGISAFENCTSLSTISLDGVVNIEQRAFYACSALTSIIIPSSVESIGANAFFQCTGVTSVTFQANSSLVYLGQQAFAEMTNTSLTSIDMSNLSGLTGYTKMVGYVFEGDTCLKNVVFAPNMTCIPEYTFYNCAALTSVTGINQTSMTLVKTYAFAGCGSLTTIPTMAAAATIEPYAFYYDYGLTTWGNSQITGGPETIGDYAFANCTSLTSVTDLQYLTSIGAYAFSGDTSLTTISGMQSIVTLGSYAFSGCTNLSSISSLSTLQTISDHAFYNDTSLTKVSNLSSLISIGQQAFSGCSTLKTVELGASSSTTLKTISDTAFEHCSALKETTEGSSVFVIPSSVTTLGTYIFSTCTSLVTVRIGNSGENASLTYLSDYMFFYCTGLTTFYFSSSSSNMKTIKTNAFTNCTSLLSTGNTLSVDGTSSNSFIIPSTVTEIDAGAFSNCSALRNVYIGENTVTLKDHIFSGDTSISVFINQTYASVLSNINSNKTNQYWNFTDGSGSSGTTRALIYYYSSTTPDFSIVPAYAAGYWSGTVTWTAANAGSITKYANA
jgi:hypothetical protein